MCFKNSCTEAKTYTDFMKKKQYNLNKQYFKNKKNKERENAFKKRRKEKLKLCVVCD